MNSTETRHILQPGFARAYIRNFCLILLAEAVGVTLAHWQSGHWPSEADRGGFILGPSMMPLIVYVAFTPRRIEWSDTEFFIQLRLDNGRSFTWQQLKAFGDGNNVFVLRFHDARAYQIDFRAFDRAEWQVFLTFLRSQHPGKRSKSWLLGL